ncbi:hypothetical protein Nhal_0288 [Nitrosococcus halophilus Nc 4]|uniref:Lipoprotein n=2 Tax=Nitrosococcus halophilus TaxID=133539 RepID=D5BUT7_NITHN|nr:hypothetical protein Nhal_0288 [Nitrosococcus halophilus Nc 4]
MGRDSALIALFIALTLGLISCAPPPEPRLAIKTLVVENKETQGIVVKLRWSLDKEKFTGKDRYRFPECGFTLYRKEEDSAQPSSTVFKPLGTFSLPQSKSELISRLQQIKDEAIKYRLLSPEGLKEEGNHLWQAIEVSQTGKQHPFPAEPMDLLTLAAINPDMAQVLGLLYVDTAVARGKKYTYKLVGAWDQTPGGGISCKSGPANEVVTDPPVETTPEGPLNTPLWVDIKKDTPLKQLRYITFDKPEQQVTVFWDKPTGTKQKPPSFVPEGPVVRLR